MHLKQITLQGFKSFAGSTSLNFEKGITCVVGPNGSGKSNVVDALAWVMGEQGTKSLRGGKMEDVIFAGTASRSPLGRAEVKLTIDNSSGTLPIEYAEVTIARTLYRNGTSEYAINGEGCRLLDVQELLSDSGLGREMHSIVGQGQLDSILRANPMERRALIEEAAGVLKYRRRKEKTERKLDSMQANLTRLSDLISEVKRNLRPLGRQAEVAKQATGLAAEAREIKTRIFAIQIEELRQRLEGVTQDGSRRKSEAALLQDQLGNTKRAIAEIEGALSSTDYDLAREKLFELENLETRTRAAINLAHQKLSIGAVQVTEDTIETETLEADFENCSQAITELASEIASLDKELDLRIASRTEASNELDRFESESAALKSASDRAIAEFEAKKTSLDQLTDQLERERSNKEALDQDRQRLDSEVEEMESRLASLSPEESVPDGNLRDSYQQSAQVELEARRKLEEHQTRLHEFERRRDSLEAKIATLSLTLDQSDGVKDVTQSGVLGIGGLIAESIKIDAGYETAIAAALGPLADAVIAEDQGSALEALDYLRKRDLGRADILISDSEVGRGKQSAPEGAVSASSVVEAPKALLKRLEDFWIVENTEAARLILRDSAAKGKVVITANGDYISEALVSGGGKKLPSKLELAAERSSTTSALKDAQKEIDNQSAAVALAKTALERATASTAERLAELQSHDAQLASKAEAIGRLMGQIESAKQERSRLEQQIEEKVQELESRAGAIVDLQNLIAENPSTQHVIDSERMGQLVEALDRSRQAEVETRIAISALRERNTGLIREQESIRTRLANAARLREERIAAEAKKKESQSRISKSLVGLEIALGHIENLVGTARRALRVQQDQRSQQSSKLTDLRASLSSLEGKAAELGQGVQDSEMRAYELRLQLNTITDRVASELSLTVEEVLSEASIQQAEEESLEQLEGKLRKLEARLSQLGSFNPLALEECAALEERHKYLSDQLADLTAARADLASIIADLSEKIRTTFAAAFEDTKKSFEQVFPVLFPGGSGSLSLLGEENEELGVEVSVRPAGKRIERMSLLSGGERSLAALALLAAIFKARPSPFYVLDEVEAALDDTNLGRLLEVLEGLRDSSQLIVVTHQKRTMEIADALYGISMGKDGITRVVGEKLEWVG